MRPSANFTLFCRGGLSAAFAAALTVSLLAPASQAQYLGGSPQKELIRRPAAPNDAAVVQTLLHATTPPLVLTAGDSLTVQVFEIERFEYKTRVASDGTISLPLVDTVLLAGKTADQAEVAIATQLETLGMVKHPHVHISVTDQPAEVFTVAGEVNKPGIFPAYGAHTLLTAISEAGGFTTASSRNVTLLRPGAGRGYILNLGEDPTTSPVASIPVFPGDTVAVGVVGVVYVVGAVKLSGVYKMKTSTPTTVEQAVTMAGGANFEAKWKDTEIVRMVDGRRVEIPIDLKRIMQGSAEDPVLEADDIVYVPSDAFKAAIKGGGANAAVSLATAGLLRN